MTELKTGRGRANQGVSGRIRARQRKDVAQVYTLPLLRARKEGREKAGSGRERPDKRT